MQNVRCTSESNIQTVARELPKVEWKMKLFTFLCQLLKINEGCPSHK
jgi:hypothetical protein